MVARKRDPPAKARQDAAALTVPACGGKHGARGGRRHGGCREGAPRVRQRVFILACRSGYWWGELSERAVPGVRCQRGSHGVLAPPPPGTDAPPENSPQTISVPPFSGPSVFVPMIRLFRPMSPGLVPKNFSNHLKNWRNFPTIGKKFSNHWKTFPEAASCRMVQNPGWANACFRPGLRRQTRSARRKEARRVPGGSSARAAARLYSCLPWRVLVGRALRASRSGCQVPARLARSARPTASRPGGARMPRL